MTTKALAWIRKSKGEDTDIGLEQQRQEVLELAGTVADDVDTLDLGVHSGFSSLSRDGDELIDDNPEVVDAVERLRDGEYDFLVALDDRRIARDGYLQVILHACESGGCATEYIEDVDDDSMAHGVRRKVEEHVKREEIRKAKKALRARREKGYDHGRPPFGFQYDEDSKYLEPDPEEFDDAVEVLRLKVEEGLPYPEVVERTGVSQSTAWRIVNENSDLYLEHVEGEVV